MITLLPAKTYEINNSVYPAHSDPKELLVENLFSLAITQRQVSTKITMQLLQNQVNTANIPFIVDLLETHLPNVLRTQCFNDDDIPFHIEVKNTEIGHLFEHILLEYLCQLKIAKGARRASYTGRTKWNWIRDPKGKFHIRLTCGLKDADIFDEALDRTVKLMQIVLAYEQKPLFPSRVKARKNGLKNGRRLRLGK